MRPPQSAMFPLAVIPVAPTTPSPGPTTPPTNPGGNRTRSSGGGGGGGGGSAASYRRAAGKSALEKAKNLQAQIDALKYALETSFKANLDQDLADVGLILGQQTKLLKDQAAARAQAFLDTARDNDRAAAGQNEGGFGALVQERGEIMSGIIQQGAGETDALRAMVMAARNFQQNQREGNRAYFDTLRTINTGITDLNLDTQNALSGAWQGAEQERDRLYRAYYDRRSEAFTQIGNLYGQQGDYYADASEMGVGGGDLEGSRKRSEQAFMDAAKEAGKSYEQQALPAWISDYKGQEQVEGSMTNTNLAAATVFKRPERAEGATLRGWAA